MLDSAGFRPTWQMKELCDNIVGRLLLLQSSSIKDFCGGAASSHLQPLSFAVTPQCGRIAGPFGDTRVNSAKPSADSRDRSEHMRANRAHPGEGEPGRHDAAHP